MPFSCDFYKRHKWQHIWSTFTVHVVFRNVTMSVQTRVQEVGRRIADSVKIYGWGTLGKLSSRSKL